MRSAAFLYFLQAAKCLCRDKARMQVSRLPLCRSGGGDGSGTSTNWRRDSCKFSVSGKKYSEAERMWGFQFYKSQVLMTAPLFSGMHLLLSYFYVLFFNFLFSPFRDLGRKLIFTLHVL